MFLTFLRSHGRLKSVGSSDAHSSATIDLAAEVCSCRARYLLYAGCLPRYSAVSNPHHTVFQVTNMTARHEAVKLGAEKGFVVRMQCVPKRFLSDSS
jgi:hypothetical protein